MKATHLLKTYWGYTSFRPLQREIIESVLAGKDTLALLPTGGGKSICYQLPALAQDGVCLVISPLVALMQDQVNRLKELDIPAISLHAGMHYLEAKRTLENAVQGAYKLIYISPERLQSSSFREYLPALDLNLIAIDEAHCISQWGHDFRPDYLKIAALKRLFPTVPLLALTATATEQVSADIVTQLELKRPTVFRQSFKRDNLFYDVRYSSNKLTESTAEVERVPGQSAILYCRSRRQTEQIARSLSAHNIPVLSYHAGMSREKREISFREWMSGRTKVMSATTAFGMGIDKSDVRLVLHYDIPEHIEAYYQEAGRAGRDGQPSKAVLFYNQADIKQLRERTEIQFPPEAFLRQVYQAVCEYLQLPIGVEPDTYYDFDLADLCKRFSLPTLQTSYALRLLAQEGLWTLTDNVFQQPTIYITAERQVLDQIGQHHPDLGMLCISILRLYGNIFYHHAPVRLQAIARQAKMKEEQVLSHLHRLQAMGVLEFRQPKDSPQLYFHHLRADSRHLIIDTQRILLLRNRHIAKTEAMIAFLTNTSECRERVLLRYFGEGAGEDCGHCDICKRGRAPALDDITIRDLLLNRVAATAISLDQLLQPFPMHEKEHVTAIFRRLVDTGQVQRNPDGLFKLTDRRTGSWED